MVVTGHSVEDQERRRGPRVAPAGKFRVEIAVRSIQGTQPLTVRDISVVGMGLTGPRPLPVALGERVYLLVDFLGMPMLRGAMLRARVRRRRPDRDGWFVGVEVDDLRQTHWCHVAAWIDGTANGTRRRQVHDSLRGWPEPTLV